MSDLGLYLATLLAVASLLGVVALRLLFRTVKVGLLLALPALPYVVYQH